MLLSSAAGSPAEHDSSGALSLHPLSGARIIRNPLGGLSSLERDGAARVLASCDADGRLISLTDSAGTSGIIRRGSFSYALADGRETLAGVPFPAGRFVRNAHGNTRILHFVSDHIGTPRVLVSNGDVVARLDLMPSGVKLSSSGFDELHGDADRLRFAGKEDLSGPSLGMLPLLDFGARLYDPVSLAWDSPDPLAWDKPNFSPYAYCNGDPVNIVDPSGLDEWELDEYGNIVRRIRNEESDTFRIIQQHTNNQTNAETNDENHLNSKIIFPYNTVTAVRNPSYISIDQSTGIEINTGSTMFEIAGDDNAKQLFEFLSSTESGTLVEWVHAKIGTEESGRNIVGTNHLKALSSIGGYLRFYNYHIRELNHNHPSGIAHPSPNDIKESKSFYSYNPNTQLNIYVHPGIYVNFNYTPTQQ